MTARSRLRAVEWFSVLVCLFVAMTGLARANTRLVVADGVSLVLPPGFHHELTQIDGRATLFEVHDGSDTLVVVVYRADKGGVPGAAAALDVHLDEVTSRLNQRPRVTHEPLGLSLLGERRPTARLHTKGDRERLGWVVAADAFKGKTPRVTVVCSALHLPGSPNAAAFAQIAASITSR